MSRLQLSTSQLRAVSEEMAQIREGSVYQYPYPWEILERDLQSRDLSGLPLVAYGSLINIKSAKITFSDQSCNKCRPVVSFGVRRLFNYKLPKDNPRYGKIEGHFRGALNINATNKIDDVVNGILFEIPLGEIPECRSREIGYDLLPVVTINWNEIEEPPFLAYILRCPDDPINGKNLISDDIFPNKPYYITCRNGARAVSEEFLRFWLATTYLADGITPVSKWETAEFPEIRTAPNGRLDLG